MLARSFTDLGVLVADRRRRLGLTQAQLAEEAGVTREWLNRFERGASGAAIGKVFRVVEAAGLALDVEEQDEITTRSAGDDLFDSLR